MTAAGDRVRWVELPGRDPARVYVHGLGAPEAFARAVAEALPG